MAENAAALRAKASWYRYLAEQGYDERIIRELSLYASELESEADCLDEAKVPCE